VVALLILEPVEGQDVYGHGLAQVAEPLAAGQLAVVESGPVEHCPLIYVVLVGYLDLYVY